MRVLLPAPFGPASPKTSLSPIVRVKPSSARMLRPKTERYVWPTASNAISGE